MKHGLIRKFRSGDVVKLKSGGPAMTVYGYVNDGGGVTASSVVICQWFAGTNAESAKFDQEMLTIIED